MTWDEIVSLLDRLLEDIRVTHHFDLHVELVCDFQGSYPKARDFAQTDGQSIMLSPKIIGQPYSRVAAILMHELGHILLMRSGDYTHTEIETDQISEICFGVLIYYDIEGVQTLDAGVRPRPPHLPN